MVPVRRKQDRPEALRDGPMRYAPRNELGVVFLFAHLAKKYRLSIEEIHAGFPDCIAYQKAHGKEKRILIEFEFRSRNFRTDEHPARGCDWLVCWEDNWPDKPRGLQVVELRRHFGLGFNVWIQPIGDRFKQRISEYDSFSLWSVPSGASKDDLLLMYYNRPDMCIRDIFVLTGPVKYVPAKWKTGKDYMAPTRRVLALKAPVYLEDLRQHRILRTAPFVRGSMFGRPNATGYWPFLYDLIVGRNPPARRVLSKYRPEKLG